MHSTPVRTWYQ